MTGMCRVRNRRSAPLRTWRLLWLSLIMLAAPVAARATGGTATERAAQAQTACLTGDYAKGVAILAELYVSTRNAIYIFNQGRCFEQNGKYEEAILRFREYQRKNAAAGAGEYSGVV